jgi:hypothetical protein
MYRDASQQNIKFDTHLSSLLVQYQLIEGEPAHNISTKDILNITTSADDDNKVRERVYYTIYIPCINNRPNIHTRTCT